MSGQEESCEIHELRAVLEDRGVYPDESRPRAWRTLLQLPRNQTAFEQCEALGVHPKFARLHEVYPAHTRRTVRRLAAVLSALAHWSPLSLDLPFLPAVVFPFVKVFGGDLSSTFEVVLVVLFNWAWDWVAVSPGAPVAMLVGIEELLASKDQALHSHLRLACGCDDMKGSVHLTVIWPLAQNLLTEVLPRAQRLQLWDHLVAHWSESQLFAAALVAFLCCARNSAFQLPPRSPDLVARWLETHHEVNMNELLSSMYAMEADIVHMRWSVSGSNGGLGGKPLPLPLGRYPPLQLPPRGSEPTVADQPKQDAGTRCEHQADDGAALCGQHDAWSLLSDAASRLWREGNVRSQQYDELWRSRDARRRLDVQEEERFFDMRRRANEKMLEQRLEEATRFYNSVEESLAREQVARAAQGRQAVEDLRKWHKERSFQIESRLQKEAVLNMELEGMQRVSGLIHERQSQESVHGVAGLVTNRPSTRFSQM